MRQRKYTESEDGQERCNITITLRFTKEQIKWLEDNYKLEGYKSPKAMVHGLVLMPDNNAYSIIDMDIENTIKSS